MVILFGVKRRIIILVKMGRVHGRLVDDFTLVMTPPRGALKWLICLECAASPEPHHEMPLNTETPNSKRVPHDPAPSANDDTTPAAHDVSSPSVLFYAIPYKNRNLLAISANHPHSHRPRDLLRSGTTTSAYPSNFAA